jgi:hypothetical protein
LGAAAALFVGSSDDRRFVVPVLVVFVLISRANGVTERQAAAFGYPRRPAA